MTRETILSADRVYRYTLWRQWDPGEDYVLFIGLNPSTADETQDDPTIRREMAFAKAWGYSGLAKGNLFGYRATEPGVMKARAPAVDVVGPENDIYLLALAASAKMIVAAWGAHGRFRGRHDYVTQLLQGFDLYALSETLGGAPGHPLYLPQNSLPHLWRNKCAT